MSKSDYIKLGEFIEQINERNIKELYGANELRGINNEGKVMLSKANIIGVSFHTYKIAQKGYFIYNPARLDIGSISCLQEDVAIFSQMYVIFKIKDECKDILLPEYLWMWFKRKAFFRYVAFVNFGSVREMFTYEDMCNVMLPVPSIDEQRRIVSEYQTVERRIANNEALIQKLEETAQAIYHHTFVEGIDEEKLPEGWRISELADVCEYNTSNLKSTNNFNQIRYFDTSSVTNNKFDNCSIIDTCDDIPSRARRLVQEGDILYSTVRPNLCHHGIIRDVTENTVVSTGFIVLRSIIDYIPNEYLYLNITRDDVTAKLQDVAEQGKSTYPSIKDEDLMKLYIIMPPAEYFKIGEGRAFSCIYHCIANVHKENTHLRTLLSLLTSRLS